MRKLLYCIPLVVVAGVLIYNYGFAPDDGRALLARAITAHGGEENLARTRRGRIHGTGTRTTSAHDIQFVWEETFHLPDRAKRTIREPWLGELQTTTYLYGDGKCRIYDGKELKRTQEVGPGDLQGVTDVLGQLVKMRQARAKLTPLPEAQVRGRPTVGFATRSDEWGQVKLWFLHDRALLVRMMKQMDGPEGELPVDVEMLLDGYKEFAGIPMPTRIILQRDGRVSTDMTVKEVKFLDRIDDAAFAPP